MDRWIFPVIVIAAIFATAVWYVASLPDCTSPLTDFRDDAARGDLACGK